MRALLDTNILTEFVRPNGNPAVKSAVETIPDADVYLSVITIGEIVKGITLLTSGPKKKYLTTWLANLEHEYGDRILPVDLEIARIWGEITARSQKTGLVIPSADGLLAAKAVRHGLHVMTRNTRHFEPTGAMLVDPWQDA